jgi:hypothetical protein
LRRAIDPQFGRQLLHISGHPAAVGGEDRRELHTAGILPQALFGRLQPRFRRKAGYSVQLRRYHAVGSRNQIAVNLPVDGSEQHQDEGREHAGRHERPVEGVRAHELQMAHRNFAAQVSRHGAKDEAGTANIVDQWRFVGPVNLVAKAPHMRVDQIGRGHEFVVPDLLEQHGPRQQLIRTAHVLQKAKLARQQRDPLAFRYARSGRVPALRP